MAKKQLVLAFFKNEAAADEAAKNLKGWDKASREVKLGAIAVLVKDDQGKIKTEKLGQRKTGAGAVLGALVAVLTGGISVLWGAVGGGILGAFFHKGLGSRPGGQDDGTRVARGAQPGGYPHPGTLAAPAARRFYSKPARVVDVKGVGHLFQNRNLDTV